MVALGSPGSRAALALASLVLALGLAELGLRLAYPALPSLAAEQGQGWAVVPSGFGTSRDSQPQEIPPEICRPTSPPVPVTAHSPGAGPPLALWVVGDSFTTGVGAPPDQGYAWLLAQDLAAQTKRAVDLTVRARPGASFCLALQSAEEALSATPRPDVVVLQLFADDLEDHAMVATGQGVVLFPSSVGSSLGRALVERSYAANLAWFGAERLHGVPPRRHIDGASQAWFVRRFAALRESLAQGGQGLVVTLLGPTGLAQCQQPAPIGSRCESLPRDMVLIGNLLDDAGVPFVDLRELWLRHPDLVRTEERKAALTPGGCPIHPDAEGHRVLAEALLPAVVDAVPPLR